MGEGGGGGGTTETHTRPHRPCDISSCPYLCLIIIIASPEIGLQSSSMMLTRFRNRISGGVAAALIIVTLALAIRAQETVDTPDTNGEYGFTSSTATTATTASVSGTLVYAENDDGQVFQRTGVSAFSPGGTGWTLKTQAPQLSGVNLGGPFGAAWGLSRDRAAGGTVPYFENFFTGTWYSTSGGLTSVDIGGPNGYVWGVNSNGLQYFRVGAGPTSPGIIWTPVVSSIFLTQIAIGGGGATGDVFGLGVLRDFRGNRNIYYREGITLANPTGSGWTQIDGQLTQISVGGGFPSGPSVGPLLSSSSTTVVWGVNNAGQVYRRTGISASNRAGTDWQFVSGSPRMLQVSVNGDGSIVWARSATMLYWRSVDGRSWNPVQPPFGGFGSGSSGVTAF